MVEVLCLCDKRIREESEEYWSAHTDPNYEVLEIVSCSIADILSVIRSRESRISRKQYVSNSKNIEICSKCLRHNATYFNFQMRNNHESKRNDHNY